MKIRKIFYFIVISAFIISCEDRTDITEPNFGNANFSKIVSIGNSLTAGYQSSALFESAQKYSYGKLIANQVGSEYVQPTISDPGMGGRIDVVSLEPFTTKIQPLNAGVTTNTDYGASYNNLGIPGALLPDILQATSHQNAIDNTNLFFDIVLRGKGTVLEQAIAEQPTFATLWIGNNDILGYATSGGTIPHTPVEIFDAVYDQLCGGLVQGGVANVIVANIPNVKAIPYFTTVGPSIGLAIQAAKTQNPDIVGLVYQMTAEPYINVATIENLTSLGILITLRASSAAGFIGDTKGLYYSTTGTEVPAGVNTAYPFGLTPENPFPNKFVLDAVEQTEVQSVISAFNTSINNAATKYNFGLVDVNSFFNNAAQSGGLSINGLTFTTEFLKGGLFSLDGVHPTSQGYAIIANEFIKVINSKFNADVPPVNVASIPGSLEFAKKITFNKFGLPNINENILESIFY
jgi:lysophospholipase L1-like esterase